MGEFLLSPAARLDLFDIWEYIAENDIEAADRVRDEIYEAILRVIMMPTIRNILYLVLFQRYNIFAPRLR